MHLPPAQASAKETLSGAAGSGAILAACGAVLPPLATFAPLGLAALLGVTALALLAVSPRSALAAARQLRTLVALVLALALWGLASTAWSILPQHSLIEALRLLAIVIGGVVVLGAAADLPPRDRDRVTYAAAIGVGLAVVLLLIERSTGAVLTRFALGLPPDARLPLTHFDRGATTLVLALWPAASGLGARRGALAALAILVAAAGAVLAMTSTTAQLALLLSLAAFGLACLAPRLVAVALATGLLAAAIVLPLATPSDHAIVTLDRQMPWIKGSAIHRLLIWRFTAERIAERPILGWGLDASRDLPGGQQDMGARLPSLHLHDAEALPLHPHDAALQWRVELGLPGTALCLAIVGWGLWRVGFAAALTPRRRAAALAWATAALVIALLSYGIWQEWWLACLWLTAALGSATGVGVRHDG